MNKKTEAHDRVKLIRIEKKMSREEVASKLDISVTAYGRIERGGTELSISRLEQLAEIFGVDKEELIGVSSNDNTDELLEEIKKLNKKIEDLQNIVSWIYNYAIEENPFSIPVHKEYVEKIKDMGLDKRIYSDTRHLSEEDKENISKYIIDRAMKIEEIARLIKNNILTLEDWKKQVKAYIYRSD